MRNDVWVTKNELKQKLSSGLSLDEVLPSSQGQESTIFTTYNWPEGNTEKDRAYILYIPGYEDNDIISDKRNLSEDEIDHILSECYTKDDFMDLAFQNEKCARDLWNISDWQHPDVEIDLMTCTTDEEAKESYGESWTEMKSRLNEKNNK